MWEQILVIWLEALLCYLPRETDCLCGLVVRVPGCRHRDPGFDTRFSE
jgi:hypothetical protein